MVAYALISPPFPECPVQQRGVTLIPYLSSFMTPLSSFVALLEMLKPGFTFAFTEEPSQWWDDVWKSPQDRSTLPKLSTPRSCLPGVSSEVWYLQAFFFFFFFGLESQLFWSFQNAVRAKSSVNILHALIKSWTEWWVPVNRLGRLYRRTSGVQVTSFQNVILSSGFFSPCCRWSWMSCGSFL